MPLTKYRCSAKNTIIYEQEPGLREHIFKLFATNHSPSSQASTLKELLCCLPKVLIPKDLGYNNLFRVLIVQFIDAEAFDVRSVKKSCIHIAHPDGKRLMWTSSGRTADRKSQLFIADFSLEPSTRSEAAAAR